mmetsp:Transcript_74534/g.125664  ORF Transcript_74534/g.125664 Transcript_74534/m.125664 type:complete len:271 (-) Transcript_74534:1027-1839(-)
MLCCLVNQVVESIDNVLMELLEICGQGFLAVSRILKLHVRQTVELGGQRGLDLVPGDGVVDRSLVDGLLGKVIESADVLQHPYSLVKWAILVIRGECILLQEIFTSYLGNLQNNFVALGKRILPNQLHNFLQVFLMLQHFGDLGSQTNELGVVLLEVGLQRLQVLGVTNEPVHGREMLPLGQLLVQPPENLHDGQCSGSNRVRKVTTWRRHGTDNTHGSFAIWASQTLYTSSTLVERSQTCSQISRVTLISRHLSQTTGNLTQSLSPTRR